MSKNRTLTGDIALAALVLTALVALIVYVMPGYLDRNDESEPQPINTITKITDRDAGIENLPCTLTKEGC